MKYFDVLFPVNIGPLTYRCNDPLSNFIRPGIIVNAPLKNRLMKGVVIAESAHKMNIEIRDIQSIYNKTPVISDKMIDLLKWMSEYYLTEQGIVLKNIIPKEALTKIRSRRTIRKQTSEYPFQTISVSNDILGTIIDSVEKRVFKTFLLHTPSTLYESSFIIELLNRIKNAIIIVPEVKHVNLLYMSINKRLRERVCLFHSSLSKGKRSEAIEKILKNKVDIVIGTRSAVFAPLKEVSFIAVLQEQSSSYKQENAPCYNARDVAVKRGYLERSTVLLSSICPSLESIYNCSKGKYMMLKPEVEIKRPKIKIIDMRYEKILKPYISKSIVNASLRHLKQDKKVMFFLNRRGHSRVLQCMDCNYREECPYCKIPLIFHKQDMSLRCHYCGYVIDKIPDFCGGCKGYNMQLFGAGTQRIQEDIEGLIGIETLRIDSDRIKRKSELEGLVSNTLSSNYRIIIGTKLLTGRLSIFGGFSMAAILNADLYLNLPDFRSAEKAFQEIMYIADKIESRGDVFIQTRMPNNYLYKCLKNYAYLSFIREELHIREILNYPPYSKLILIKIIAKDNHIKEIKDIVSRSNKDIKILGPSLLKKRQRCEIKLLLKATNQKMLHNIAKILIESLKVIKDIKVRVDVDPISI